MINFFPKEKHSFLQSSSTKVRYHETATHRLSFFVAYISLPLTISAYVLFPYLQSSLPFYFSFFFFNLLVVGCIEMAIFLLHFFKLPHLNFINSKFHYFYIYIYIFMLHQYLFSIIFIVSGNKGFWLLVFRKSASNLVKSCIFILVSDIVASPGTHLLYCRALQRYYVTYSLNWN